MPAISNGIQWYPRVCNGTLFSYHLDPQTLFEGAGGEDFERAGEEDFEGDGEEDFEGDGEEVAVPMEVGALSC